MKRQTGWLKALPVIKRVEKERMIGERRSLITWRIHPEKSLGNSGTKP
jgi:hypothetical protein